MSTKLNPKKSDFRVSNERLAGGAGSKAAIQSNEQQLRRATLASLLWEDLAYVDGESNSEIIAKLVPTVEPYRVASLVRECREQQKLRHIPLFLLKEMLKHEKHKKLVGELVPLVCTRPDQITDLLALYWKESKIPLPNQLKKGIGKAFNSYTEYQLAKYNRKGTVTLRDALFLTHPKPKNSSQQEIFNKLVNDELTTPDTWEVCLSNCSSKEQKKLVWERLISENKLGALAFLRNLRNMKEVRVNPDLISYGFTQINAKWVLPLNFWAAVKAVPEYTREIENCMLKAYSNTPKLNGRTLFIIDTSGSMYNSISCNSKFNRIDAGSALAVLAGEKCEQVDFWATSGDDSRVQHSTKQMKPYRGFALYEEIKRAPQELGSGGIFTRQCLEYIKSQINYKPDRIIIFSDSQDCDRLNNKLPDPFGVYNYIVDVSAESRGINYKGIWTAEVSGWSENFLNFIAEKEKQEYHE